VVLDNDRQAPRGVLRWVWAEQRSLLNVGIGGGEQLAKTGKVAVCRGARDRGGGGRALHRRDDALREQLAGRGDQRLARSSLLVDTPRQLVWYRHLPL
jgi:hypothetical protein